MREDGGVGDVFDERSGDAEVVDAPPDVALAGAGTVGPPGVGFGFVGVVVAEGVGESGV